MPSNYLKSLFLLLGMFFLIEGANAEECHLAIHPCSIRGCDAEKNMEVIINVQKELTISYSRHKFLIHTGGRGWDDSDHDCKDTRAEVLEETSLIPVVYSNSGCNVIMGLWYDPYSGAVFEDSSDLDIDHVVPIKEAHESGAVNWSAQERARFANNYGILANLIPVWNSLNRSKGAKEPMTWLPPNKEYQCEYVNRWAYVKWMSDLSMDIKECELIKELLTAC